MTKLTLQERLIHYLKARPHQKIAKGDLCDLARQKMGVTGETVGRRLRVLTEVSLWGYRPTDSPEHRKAHQLLAGGKLKVEYKDKHHAWYWYEPPATRTERRIVVEDGKAKEVVEEVPN